MEWNKQKPTLGQSCGQSNPVNIQLLNETDEVWLRLINLRERLSVGYTIYYHCVQQPLCIGTYAVQKQTNCTYRKVV